MRTQISDEAIKDAENEVSDHIKNVLQKHGKGTFASRHEVYGVLMEEVREFERAIEHGTLDQIAYELKDIAQVCIFGLACIKENAPEW